MPQGRKPNLAKEIKGTPPIYEEGPQPPKSRMRASRVRSLIANGVDPGEKWREWYKLWDRYVVRKRVKEVKFEFKSGDDTVTFGDGAQGAAAGDGDDGDELENAGAEVAALDIVARSKVKTLEALIDAEKHRRTEDRLERENIRKTHNDALEIIAKSQGKANEQLQLTAKAMGDAAVRLMDACAKMAEMRGKTASRADKFALKYMKKLGKLQKQLAEASAPEQPTILAEVERVADKLWDKIKDSPLMPILMAKLGVKLGITPPAG